MARAGEVVPGVPGAGAGLFRPRRPRCPRYWSGGAAARGLRRLVRRRLSSEPSLCVSCLVRHVWPVGRRSRWFDSGCCLLSSCYDSESVWFRYAFSVVAAVNKDFGMSCGHGRQVSLRPWDSGEEFFFHISCGAKREVGGAGQDFGLQPAIECNGSTAAAGGWCTNTFIFEFRWKTP